MKESEKEEYTNSLYEKQNKILKQLHEQRIKRQQQLKSQTPSFQHSIQIKPQLKVNETLLQPNKISKQIPVNDCQGIGIYLNSLYYDCREIKPKFFIKFSSLFHQDVLGKENKTMYISENVQSIFLTTFGFETQTFERLLTESQAKVVILNDSDEVGKNKVLKCYDGYKNLTVILKARSPNQRYGVFHTKLWLIKFKQFLRVVVCTSNQHTMDWATWQNAYWYQDFILKNNKKYNQNQLSQQQIQFNQDFYKTLNQVIKAMITLEELEQFTNVNLDKYLFDNVKVVLIPSIPGRHTGSKMKQLGIGKVQQIMKKYNKIKDPILTYQTTSLGIVDRKLVEQIYYGFCPNEKKFALQKFKLIYPTQQYIEQQTGGQAQVLFLTSQNYNKSQIANKILYKFDTNPNNTILGCIPHLKLIIIQSNNINEDKGIIYMGSHNMTKAAWGKLQKRGIQLYIANSQLGIIFFNVDFNFVKMWSPFKYPPEPYRENDMPYLRDFQG